jgi:hypothetical protein
MASHDRFANAASRAHRAGQRQYTEQSQNGSVRIGTDCMYIRKRRVAK